VRAKAALETRRRVIQSAMQLLRADETLGRFSLDAVAKVAGLTRLTVYNQFGSRRGLLEAVFDEIAAGGGLRKIQEAMRLDDPREALDRVIEIFCAFWASDAAIARLHDATAIDPEFAQALNARNEGRRKLLDTIVRRILGDDVAARTRRDAVDLIYACTSQSMYRMLRTGRSRKAVCNLVKRASGAAIEQ
jgi:AcrR family transcriptional regulator